MWFINKEMSNDHKYIVVPPMKTFLFLQLREQVLKYYKGEYIKVNNHEDQI